jgi:hypothetical protein
MQEMQGIHNLGTFVTKTKCYVMDRRVIITSKSATKRNGSWIVGLLEDTCIIDTYLK